MTKNHNIITQRRSVRSYLKKDVPDHIINQLIKLAHTAPTASGKENREFIVIKDQKVKDKVCEAGFNQTHLKEAPIIVAVVYFTRKFDPITFLKESKKWGTNFWDANVKNYQKKTKFKLNWKKWTSLWPIQDADTAITTLCLAAVALDLSTCWVGLFEHNKVKKILNLPKNYELAGLITVGYQKSKPYPQTRKKITDLIHQNHW